MATEYASLVFRVDSSQIAKADQRMGGLTRSSDGATGAIKRLAAQFISAAAAIQGLRKLVDVTRQFDVLNAQLITATGSAEKATVAFQGILDFATRTPYDLAQVTDAFVRLQNLGLDPSEKALTSYGNTASAMGRSLNQMIEAVADAATGEFERLKEFGIRASKQGDQVTFTFRGVSQTVAFESQAIQGYLLALGETNFDGAMLQRMDTLDGALSNLGDEWDKLFLNISQQGTGSLIEETVRGAIGALEDLNAAIASEQLDGYIRAFSGQFQGMAVDFDAAMAFMEERYGQHATTLGLEAQSLSSFLSASMQQLPTNVRSFIQILTVELLAFIDKTKLYGEEMLDNLTFWDDTVDIDTGLAQIERIRFEMIDSILAERDASLASYESKIAASDALRVAYEAEAEARRNAGGDALAGLGGDSGVTATGSATPDFSGLSPESLQTFSTYIDAMAEKTNYLKDAFSDFGEEASRSISRVIMRGGDAEDVMKSLAQTIVGNLVEAMVQFGVQQAITFAQSKMFAAATTAANSAQASLTASLWAPAAGLASLATGGLNAVPASAAITSTVALAQGLALTGGRELGGQVLPNNSYIVGERGPEVLTMGSTAGNVSQVPQVSQQSQQPQEVVINQTIQAVDAKSVQQVMFDNQDYLAGLINRVMNDRGMAL